MACSGTCGLCSLSSTWCLPLTFSTDASLSHTVQQVPFVCGLKLDRKLFSEACQKTTELLFDNDYLKLSFVVPCAENEGEMDQSGNLCSLQDGGTL